MSEVIRNQTSLQAANELGVSRCTVLHWVKVGAPYTLGVNRQNQETFLVNAAELKEWRAGKKGVFSRMSKVPLPKGAVPLKEAAKILNTSRERLYYAINHKGAPAYYEYPDAKGRRARRGTAMIPAEFSAWLASRNARPPDVPKDAVPVKEAAKQLGLTESTIFSYVRRYKDFPHYSSMPIWIVVEEVKFWNCRKDHQNCITCGNWFIYKFKGGNTKTRCVTCTQGRIEAQNQASKRRKRNKILSGHSGDCLYCHKPLNFVELGSIRCTTHVHCKRPYKRQRQRSYTAARRAKWEPAFCVECDKLIPLSARRLKSQKRHRGCAVGSGYSHKASNKVDSRQVNNSEADNSQATIQLTSVQSVRVAHTEEDLEGERHQASAREPRFGSPKERLPHSSITVGSHAEDRYVRNSRQGVETK